MRMARARLTFAQKVELLNERDTVIRWLRPGSRASTRFAIDASMVGKVFVLRRFFPKENPDTNHSPIGHLVAMVIRPIIVLSVYLYNQHRVVGQPQGDQR
jgi:hypothetical protein